MTTILITFGIAALALMGVIALAPFFPRVRAAAFRPVFVAGLVLATLYGGTKVGRPKVGRDEVLEITAAWFGTVTNITGAVTNAVPDDTVHIRWRVKDAYAGLVPPTAQVDVDCAEIGTTNFQPFASATVGEGAIDGWIANATNYEYFVYVNWTPPSPVETNGVYHLNLSKPKANRYVPLRIEVRLDDEVITPSHEARPCAPNPLTD